MNLSIDFSPWLTIFDFNQPQTNEMQDRYARLKHRFQTAIDADAQCIYWEPDPCGFIAPIVWPVFRLHGEYAHNENGRQRWAEKVSKHQKDDKKIGDPFAPMHTDVQGDFGGWLNPTKICVIDFRFLPSRLRYKVIRQILHPSLADKWRSLGKGRWRGEDTLCIHVECRSGAVFEYIIDKTI